MVASAAFAVQRPDPQVPDRHGRERPATPRRDGADPSTDWDRRRVFALRERRSAGVAAPDRSIEYEAAGLVNQPGLPSDDPYARHSAGLAFATAPQLPCCSSRCAPTDTLVATVAFAELEGAFLDIASARSSSTCRAGLKPPDGLARARARERLRGERRSRPTSPACRASAIRQMSSRRRSSRSFRSCR